MDIWFKPFDLATVNDMCKNTLIEHLGIEFIEIGPNYLQAKMPVDQRTHQPVGIMHGGASCVLAETLGSVAANFCLDSEKYYSVGLDISTNHIQSIRSGKVIGAAKPIHLGKTTQIWEINIVNAQQKLISVTRLTMIVLPKERFQR